MAKTHDITVTVLKKKLFLNTKKTKWCTVQLYNYRFDMERGYVKHCKERGLKYGPVLGASCHHECIKVDSTGKQTLSGDTGKVFLSLEDCDAGVVSHELLHAVLWAWKHKKNKVQYPIIIKNMREEEQILHNHTFAVTQFYTWFWKVAKEIKK